MSRKYDRYSPAADLPARRRAAQLVNIGRSELARLRADVTPWLRAHVPHALRVERIRVTRYPSWLAERREVARVRASPELLARANHVLATRLSPLRRSSTSYDERMQAGKEHNVRRAAELLNGIVVAPQQLFSYHHVVGRPSRSRGFVDGPEMHDGRLTAGVGGGCCQVANQLLQLACETGATIVERHRHSMDLFPDENRIVPFGLGATVFYNLADLRFVNQLNSPIVLGFEVRDGALNGTARTTRPPEFRWEVHERNHRFVRRGDNVYRCNELWRVRIASAGRKLEERLFENEARVVYEVPEELLR